MVTEIIGRVWAGGLENAQIQRNLAPINANIDKGKKGVMRWIKLI